MVQQHKLLMEPAAPDVDHPLPLLVFGRVSTSLQTHIATGHVAIIGGLLPWLQIRTIQKTSVPYLSAWLTVLHKPRQQV